MMGILISFILFYKIHLSTKDKLDLFVCSFLPSDVRTCWKCLDILNHNAVRKAICIIYTSLYVYLKTLQGESFSKTEQNFQLARSSRCLSSGPVVPVSNHSLAPALQSAFNMLSRPGQVSPAKGKLSVLLCSSAGRMARSSVLRTCSYLSTSACSMRKLDQG